MEREALVRSHFPIQKGNAAFAAEEARVAARVASRNFAVRGPEVCLRVAKGRSVVSICADEGMPKVATVQRWLSDKPGFGDRLAGARTLRAEGLMDEILAIADSLKEAPSEAECRGCRLKIDARKWTVTQLLSGALDDEEDLPLSPPRFKAD